jgi:hypothetical protein
MLIQKQLVLFFEKDYNGEFENISIKLKETFEDIISTMLIPIDTNAPSEIPRLTLTAREYNINVSKNRMDIIVNKQDADNLIARMNSFAFHLFEIHIKRIGYICTHFVEKPAVRVLNEFLEKEFVSNDYSEISIRVNKPFKFKDKNCNNIENATPGQVNSLITGSPVIKDGIIIQRDLNTNATDNSPISLEVRNAFIAKFSEEEKNFIFKYKE